MSINPDRRGWWGDLDAREIWNGWPLGSKLWLLERTKITDAGTREGSTVARVESYIRQCITPFKTAKIISGFEMEVRRNPTDRQRIDAGVRLFRGPREPVSLEFEMLWDGRGRDIRIVQRTDFPRLSVGLDWQLLADGTLDETDALATAVIIALESDARASLDDELPDGISL